MKRHPAIIPLSHDHHHGLILAQLIKKDAPEYKGLPSDLKGKLNYTLNAWKSELKKHFENEEEILFPFSRGREKEVDDLIDEIIEEHNLIKNFVASLRETNNLIEKLDRLGNVLENHIRKEERVLFNRIQEILSDDELNSLMGKIKPVKKD